jgi:hypothetical protein
MLPSMLPSQKAIECMSSTGSAYQNCPCFVLSGSWSSRSSRSYKLLTRTFCLTLCRHSTIQGKRNCCHHQQQCMSEPLDGVHQLAVGACFMQLTEHHALCTRTSGNASWFMKGQLSTRANYSRPMNMSYVQTADSVRP